MGVELAHQYTDIRGMEEEEVEVEGDSYTDYDLVDHVRYALLSAKSDEKSSYHELVGVLHQRDDFAPDRVALLLTSLKALSGAVSYIDDVYHGSLIRCIFGMSMWNCGPDVMDALLELIISLAASNGKYVDLCLDMLVNNFMPPMESDMLRYPRGQAKKELVLPRVHTALEVLVGLVPMAALKLSSMVVNKRPMLLKNASDTNRLKIRIEIYLRNMLMLEDGAIREFVGTSMLVEVLNMLVELDVAIGWDEILRDDPCKGIFTMELEDEDEAPDDNGEGNDDGELPRTLSHWNLGKNATADLLDSLMVQFFEHLEACENKNRLIEVFDTLLSSFMVTILNTYKSKFAQFVIFYVCALDPENCGVKFANKLIDTFISDWNPPLTRMSAVAYLTSYLARGKFLSTAFVVNILQRLVDWCLIYCEERECDMNPKAHQVFYSACQAIMYVLCFHMRSIMYAPANELLKSQLLHMPIKTILKHQLGPLEVCLPSIVNEFLKQAKAAHLFTISKTFIFEDLLESDLSRDFGGLERLDMFFPFDPCLLKICDRSFIRPNYVYWNHVITTYDAVEDDSSDEDIAEDFEAGNGEDFMGRSLGQDLDLDYVMNKMSITPKNTFDKFSSEQMRMPSRIRPSASPESL